MASNNSGLDDDFMETMLADFLDESQVYLRNLNDKLSTLDDLVSSCATDEPLNVDIGILNEMFRDAHSLKGLSAMLQLGNINGLTHKVENLFDAARDQKITINNDVVELLYQAVDCLTGMVDQLKSEGNDNLVYQPIVDEIQRVLDMSGIKSAAMNAEELAAALSSSGAPIVQSLNLDEPTVIPMGEIDAASIDPFAGVVDEDEIPQKYRSIFVAESIESLDTLCEMLLGDPEATKVDSLLVFCHQIKGSAASIGLNRPAKLAHLMEDLLQCLRESGRTITQSINEALLFAVDSLRAYIGVLASEGDQPDNFNDAHHRLLAAQAEPAVKSEPTIAIDAEPLGVDQADAGTITNGLTAAERHVISQSAPEKMQAVAGKITFRVGLPLIEIKVLLVLQKLQNIGSLFFQTPNNAIVAQLDGPVQLAFGLTTDLPLDEIRKRVDLDGLTAIIIEPIERTSRAAIESPLAPASSVDVPANRSQSMPVAGSSTSMPESLRAAPPVASLETKNADAGQPLVSPKST